VASATNTGKLSSTDWSTFNNKQNALTNPITGTGTTNTLPKFTGASTIGNSIITDSGTTAQVNGSLVVSGGLLVNPSSGFPQATISSLGSTQLRLQAATTSFNAEVLFCTTPSTFGLIQYNNADNYFTLFTNSTAYARLFSNGNFAIGTTLANNGFKLEVEGSSNFTGALSGTSAVFSSTVQASAYRLTGMTAGSGALYWSSDRVTLANYNASGTVVIETGGGTTALTLAANQAATFSANVAIGATLSAWISSAKVLQLNNTAALYGPTDESILSNNVFVDSGDNNKYITTNFASQYRQVSGQHLFYSAASGTAGATISFGSPKLTIASSGAATFSSSVTASGNSLFSAGSTALTQNILTVKGGGASGAFGFRVEANNGDAILYTNNLTYDVIANTVSGKFGIGTTTIGSKLQVNGNAAIGYSASTAAPTNGLAVAGQSTFGTDTFTTTFNASFGTISIQSFSVNNGWFGDNVFFNGTNFVRRSSGFAGLFYFQGSEGQFRFGATGAAGGSIGNGVVTLKTNLDNTFAVGNLSTSSGVYTGANFIVNSSGSVGVGTLTIGSKIQVNGNAAIGYSASTAAPTNGLVVAGNILAGTTSENSYGANVTSVQLNGSSGSLYETRHNGASALRVGSSSDHCYIFEPRDVEQRFSTNGTLRMTIGNGGVVTIANLAGSGSRAVLADSSGVLSAPVSDISVKQNITSIGYGLKEISKMNPVWFEFTDDYKNYGEGRQNGNIAQEMAEIIPEAVFTTTSTGKMGINYDQLHAVYIKAIQELKAEIDDLKKQLK
jgi:hypothetical protein